MHAAAVESSLSAEIITFLILGRGGGQVVSVLAFYPTIRVRIPLRSNNFSVKIVIEKNENKQKRDQVWPI